MRPFVVRVNLFALIIVSKLQNASCLETDYSYQESQFHRTRPLLTLYSSSLDILASIVMVLDVSDDGDALR